MNAIRASSADPDAARLRPKVQPRETWADGIRTPRGLVAETDVRLLLVHHTQTPNGERGRKVRVRLRQIHQYHTTEKGWLDIAYNFLVDEAGTIWEGRAGSLTGPVRGDATGGSQGFAILCCFIGDHNVVEPSTAALKSMAHLLAWQAALNGVDLAPERRVTFRSRGSNRWAKGATVRTAPIAGHRDMSATECPGDAAYALIDEHLWPAARALVLAASPEIAASPRAASGGSSASGSSTETTSPPTQPSEPSRASPRAGNAPDDAYEAGANGMGIAALMASGSLAWVVARRLRNNRQRRPVSTEDR